MTLAAAESVQNELKLTDRQKKQITSLSDESNNRRREVFQNLRQQQEAARAEAAQAEQQQQANSGNYVDPNLAARDPGLAATLANSQYGGGFGQQNFGGQFQAPDNSQRQQGGNRRMAPQNWEAMRQAMEELQAGTDHSLGKILKPDQSKRLLQIQIQVEGPTAVLRPDLTEKLALSEDQVEEIRGIQGQMSEARRESFSKMRDLFGAMRGNQPQDQGGPGQGNGGQARNGRGARRQQNGNRQAGGGQGQAAAGNPAPGGPAGPGGPGGGGGRRGFDPDAMRKAMERPEVKSQMEQVRKDQEKIRDQGYAMVFKVLDRRQGAAFKQLMGKPFDVASIMGGPFRGPAAAGNAGQANANPNGNATPAATTDTKAAASPKSKASTRTTSKSRATAPRRKSYSQQRDPGDQDSLQGQPQFDNNQGDSQPN